MRKTTRHTTDPRRAIIYIRVSDDDQVKGTSLEDQERQCAAVLRTEGFEIVGTFRDEGQTAKTADRHALIDAVSFACSKTNRISVLMVWKVDRFARNTDDHFAIRGLLTAAGVKLRSATEPIGDEPNAKLFETIVAGFAEFDNSVRALRCSNGMRARIRSGVWPFRAPVGYVNRALARQGLKKTGPDPIDPVLFPLLQRLLKGYAHGLYTASAMVAELKRANFEALTGTRPSHQLVERLLGKHLRFYAGWLTDAFGDEVEYHRGLHEPMITDEEMRAIEVIRSGRPRTGLTHLRRTSEYLLKGLLRCWCCNRPLTASRSRGRTRRYGYYHCFNKSCSLRGRTLPQKVAEKLFAEQLRQLAPTPKTFKVVKAAVAAYATEQKTAAASVNSAHNAALAALEARRQRVLELAEAGAYDAGLARERLAAIEAEIATETLQASAEEPAPCDAVAVADDAEKVLHLAASDWAALPDDLRERFQKIVFPAGISIDRDGRFWNRKISSVFALNANVAAAKSSKVDLSELGSNQLLEEFCSIAAL